MKNEENKEAKKVKEVIDFLKDTIAYLENRIRLLDNKASILIATQGVIFAVFSYIMKGIFLTPDQLASYIVLGRIVLVVGFLIFIVTITLLLQTIRPTRWFIGLKVPLKHLETEDHVMWPHGKFLDTPKDYREKTKSLDLSKMQKNYEETHFVSLQLIKRKYQFYRCAVVFTKLLVLWGGVGIVILALLHGRIK